MTRSMLWLPTLNGALCGGYIVAFLALAHVVPAAWLAWLLALAIVGVWWWVARQERTKQGIPPEHQLAYAGLMTACGVLLLIVMGLVLGGPTLTTRAGDLGFIAEAERTISANWLKIAAFALVFAAFLVLCERLNLSDGERGILAGLPLVPFGGLLSIAGYGGELDQRLATLRGLGSTVWLSPAVAIGFILFVSAMLNERAFGARSFLARFAIVALGWVMTLLAILGIGIATTYVL